MDEFEISNANGIGGLTFFDRVPSERSQTIESYSVRLTVVNVSAIASPFINPDYGPLHPVAFFRELAAKWAGWRGDMAWETVEHDLILRCTHDPFGHISMRVGLRSGPMPDAWDVSATIMTEAGQLENIAKRAAHFFGKPW